MKKSIGYVMLAALIIGGVVLAIMWVGLLGFLLSIALLAFVCGFLFIAFKLIEE